ncbi:MAG: S8 family serine peptidase [Fluviicola sp.]|nr:S8 family serine peptidase [Fluviicola sp.]
MKTYLTLLLILFYQVVFAQESRVEIKYLNVNGNTIAPFSVENNSKNLAFLKENKIKIKNITKRNIYFTSTTEWLVKNKNLGNISDFHFEAIPPEVLNDSSRQLHFVNQVHQGSGGLSSAYKGKDVIVGVIDVGLDVTHPDFKDSLGKSRVIRYWDQTYSGVDKFAAYEYGKLWDSTAINNNLFSGSDPVASGGHGTSVTGRAAGNGLSVGDNEGNAPHIQTLLIGRLRLLMHAIIYSNMLIQLENRLLSILVWEFI